MSPRATILLK